FLSRGTAGNPNPYRRVDPLVLDEFGEYLILDRLKHRRLAEEARHFNEEVSVERFDLLVVLFQKRRIIRKRLLSMKSHPPHDSSADRRVPIQTEIHTGSSAYQRQDLLVLVFGLQLDFYSLRRRQVRMVADLRQPPGDLVGRQDKVGVSPGALRHAG